MWRRNLLFAVLCLFGVSAVAANLLRRDRIEAPAGISLPADADFQDTIDRVNREFRQQLAERNLPAAAAADPLTIVRRLSLGLTGTVPSLEEIRALQQVPEQRQVDWWLARLLSDRRMSDYLAERLARAYVGTENGPFIVYRRRRFVNWLSDQLADPKLRYDALVRELISGKGIWTDAPAVNFLTVTLNEEQQGKPDPIRLAGRATRAFLGMRIDCLQCHDDRLGNVEVGSPDDPRLGKQTDFHQLAAFFSDATMSPLGIRDDEHPYVYKYLHAEEEEEVAPDVPFAVQLLVTDGTKREQLARWVTHPQNKQFARATVNRTWAILFGRPLIEPIDDIPLYGPFPPGLEALAEDFVRHDYNLHRLIRLIAATDVFQRDSRADFEVRPEHETWGAVFPLTRLRPEQVAGALIQSCSLTTIDANAHVFSQLARFFQQNDFIERYGDTGEDEFEDRGGTVTQRLLLMNGELVKQRTARNLISNAATRIAALTPDDRRAVDVAYLAVLGRPPTDHEMAGMKKLLAGLTVPQREETLEDIYWVLLNSSEFSWNH